VQMAWIHPTARAWLGYELLSFKSGLAGYHATESTASGWEDFLNQTPKSLQVAVSAPQNTSTSIFRSN
jgi:hypothetical protein